MLDWAFHESQIRFDIRKEREEYQRLFNHQARVLQDRLARRGGGDRTNRPAVPEWKRVYLKLAEQQRLLHQARVLGWGKQKGYYFAHKLT
jgi:hypothetical protein